MYEVTVISGQQNYVMPVEAGTSLLEVCRNLGIFPEAECNGRGTCGKCIVLISSGEAEPAPEDLCCLTKEQLRVGIRLACRLYVQSDLVVRVVGQAGQKQIATLITESRGERTSDGILNQTIKSASQTGHQIAVDLGTTTLAAVLLDKTGKVLARQAGVNSQSCFGVDVLSRIQAAGNGYAGQMRNLIRNDLIQMIRTLSGGKVVERIAIAGNTAMLHLLLGYPCEGLGRAPFTPYSLKGERRPFGGLFDGQEAAGITGECEVCLLPGLSAFVGADITAGLYGSGFLQTPPGRMSYFVDLGTNGELAVGNGGHFLTASTAAGPAFEGGGLSCGVPGIPGAISQVQFLYHRVRVRTIGQKKPCGVCGTGALEAIAALRGEGLLNENGLLSESLFQSGMELGVREDGRPIVLTQEDIRQVQLAKSAVRAGMEALSYRYQKAHPEDTLDKVYVAGGFGYYLSLDTALAVGLFPKEWKDRIVVCGNASLEGAMLSLMDPEALDRMEHLRERNETISLAEDPFFAQEYFGHMDFPKN